MIDTLLTIHILANLKHQFLFSLVKDGTRQAPFKQVPVIVPLDPLQLRDLSNSQLGTRHLDNIDDPRLVIIHLVEVLLQEGQ